VEAFPSHLLRITKHLKQDHAWALLNTQLTSLCVASSLELVSSCCTKRRCFTVEAIREILMVLSPVLRGSVTWFLT
jgi:hypothetical protein